jgi:hypothetical protein
MRHVIAIDARYMAAIQFSEGFRVCTGLMGKINFIGRRAVWMSCHGCGHGPPVVYMLQEALKK